MGVMLSALLALLLAADDTRGPAPAPTQVIALAVDVDFTCSGAKTQSLILPPRAEAQLELPAECPDAKADWRLTLGCEPSGRCTGEIRTPQGALARLQGPREQLTLKALAAKAPATLKHLRVRVTGEHRLELGAAAEHQPPLQLLLRLPAVTGVYTLAPSEPPVPVDYEHRGQRVTLKAQVTRTAPRRVHVRLWSAKNEPLLDETLDMDQPRELACGRVEDICQGSLEVLVREYQRVL